MHAAAGASGVSALRRQAMEHVMIVPDSMLLRRDR